MYRNVFVLIVISSSCLWLGCRRFPSGGAPIEAVPLGSIVDEANRLQEENAEPAKFIVYMHEFELNRPLTLTDAQRGSDEFAGVDEDPARGFRLTPFGQDHIRRIAHELLRGSTQTVTVERSQTSKLRRTKHRYPVHFNSKLDQHRRDVVVAALHALGVENADQLVVVAPAYPFGLQADEAVQAYQAGRFANDGFGNGRTGSGGGFGNVNGISGGSGGVGGGYGLGY